MAGLIYLFRIAFLCTALMVCKVAIAVPLWEIEGADNRIRLLGSIHFLRADDYPLPRTIDRVYQDADVIVVELVLDAISLDDLLRVQQELAIDPRGRTLNDLIGASAYRNARSLASEIDIELDMLQPFEPWFAALQITQMRLIQLGFDGSYGVDSTLTRKARADGKPLFGLETLEVQLQALDTLPAAAQKRFLVQTLADAGSIEDDLDMIVKAWRQGDIEALDNLLLEGLDEQPEVYAQLLVQRNRNWTREIIGMMNDSEDYLIIVGALHLIGEDSVQNMLGEVGIRTRRIR